VLCAIDFNEKAIAIYESFGFKIMGCQREAYLEFGLNILFMF
jgi:ribosomal protein S18 acetylase RimI-like enzyme